jgi:hypothetical protein
MPDFLCIDSHVHLYREKDAPELLDTVRENFLLAAQTRHPGEYLPVRGVLVLAEVPGREKYPLLRDWARREEKLPGVNGWRFLATAEDDSVLVAGKDGTHVFLLRGRQARTRDNLEVLCFGCPDNPADGMPLRETLSRVFENGGLAILPWGVGKWLGARGRVVMHMMDEFSAFPLFLGDNGGRPAVWGHIPQFRKAEAMNMVVLRGTDPLPLPGEHLRVGSFGNVLAGSLRRESPARDLAGLLRNLTTSPPAFGRPLPLVRFMRNQIMLRAGKGVLGATG